MCSPCCIGSDFGYTLSPVDPSAIVTEYQTQLPPSANTDRNVTNNATPLLTVPKGYLVWSPQCKMVNLNYMAKDVMSLVERLKPAVCSDRPPLTRVKWRDNGEKAIIEIDVAAKSRYYSGAIYCKAQQVLRKTEGEIE